MTHNPFPSGALARMVAESAQRSSTLHKQFLQTRQADLQNVRALIEMQITGSAPAAICPSALFDSRQLDAFGTGRLSDCLGPYFARYDARRIPRIPNGDLRMMSRIVAIQGCPRDFSQPASITAEYDVPPDAWFLRESACPDIPASLYMEIALQPCGFLSAYLDTYAFGPGETFFFRNLDGSLRCVKAMDVRGKTIITTARMLTSVVSGGTVIQKFSFELTCQGHTLYTGESTFGYFSPATMANQVGLDGGKSVLPAFQAEPGLRQVAARLDLRRLQTAAPDKPSYRLESGRLNFIDDVFMIDQGGSYGKGLIYASRPVNPQDWFYPFHFYQDPVMPGSLGVEAMVEAVKAYALARDLGYGLHSPRFSAIPGAAPMTWRYRGQITQQHQQMELEVHISGIEQRANQAVLTGDASLWVDGLRIYEVKNLAIGLVEA